MTDMPALYPMTDSEVATAAVFDVKLLPDARDVLTRTSRLAATRCENCGVLVHPAETRVHDTAEPDRCPWRVVLWECDVLPGLQRPHTIERCRASRRAQ